MLKLTSLLILLLGCASKPTPYQPMKKHEGYKEKTLEGLQVVVFRGNSYSKKAKARFYAEFRAIEVCRETGFKLANIFDFMDKTTSRDVIRTSSFGPSYYYGMSPFYSRYSGFGMSAGFGNSVHDSWKETYVYPNIEVVFRCSNEAVRPELLLREVPAEEMKHLVKDLKGALQVEKVPEDSPNKGNLLPGDIILKLGETRIQRIYELLSTFKAEAPVQKAQVLRDGERVVVSLKGKDVSSAVREVEQKVVDEACKEEEIKTRPACKK